MSFVVVTLVILQNFVIGRFFPHLTRVSTDFSPAYLGRELRSIAKAPPQTIFLGDSVLWGYRIDADQGAVSLMRANGLRCINLSFKGSSPPNYYALVRLFARFGVRPKAVVIEVNQKVFNEADPAYRTLHPGVQGLVAPQLSLSDRSTLSLVSPNAGFGSHVDLWMGDMSLMYAMRSDIRETLHGDTDAAPTRAPGADQYVGTYDLSPLTVKNVGVRYLNETVRILHAEKIPVLAFFTPTNHVLLHEYIDNAEYRANEAFLKRELRKRGAAVLDLDAVFPANAFIDESHLTVAGQIDLAAILQRGINRLLLEDRSGRPKRH